VEQSLPPAVGGTALRILATADLAAALVPMATTYGRSGTCDGIARLLASERERQPTIWLDAGDLVVGPAAPLLGRRPWREMAQLPLAAAAAGNHEFDDGVPALREAARMVPFPLLCANIEVGLPGSAVVDTAAGPIGVIGLTHPFTDRYAPAPPPADGWRDRVAPHARELRSDGARWVVVLVHDGVDWWPCDDGDEGLYDGNRHWPIQARRDRLEALAAPWAADVDLVLGGHTPGAWVGELAGTPAGHAFTFASSVLVVDLPQPPAPPMVRGIVPAPATRPATSSPAIAALDAAASDVVGHSSHAWISRTGARRYLPDLIAEALRTAAGADAGFVLAAQHTTQGALDGAVAGLARGPVTRLDLMRLFGYGDDRPVVVRLRPGELRRAVDAHNAVTDPRARHADRLWWNWCRMPAGVSVGVEEPSTVAVLPFVVPRLAHLVDRGLAGEPAGIGVRDALVRVLR
jgi:2',3'-cyclic-nucleotide 2'-phosphodiesterase (5'-nucleotidase family)